VVAEASGASSTAVGEFSVASGAESTVVGGTAFGFISAEATGDGASAFGNGAWATGDQSTAIGWLSSADGPNSTALGAASWAEVDSATALGYGSYASADNSVALGAGSVADRADSVSVGEIGGERQITNVAAGTEDTDAVNLAQLNDVADASAAATRYFKAAGANDGTDDAAVNGTLGVAVGSNAESNGAYAIAIGNNASTQGNYGGTAIGGGFANDPTRQNIAGQFGTSVGFGTQAKGVGDTAMGTYANTGDTVDPTSDATNSYRTAIGYKSFASGDAAVALGTFNTAIGQRSTALGYEADSNGDDSVAVGSRSSANGVSSIAIGAGASTQNDLGVAIGSNAQSNGVYAIAIGNNASTQGNYGGTAIGGGFADDPTRQNIAGQFGTSVGFGTQAKGVGDTAMGTYANTGDTVNPTDDTTNSYRTAIGYKAFASGDAAIAVGTFNSATGARSAALGYEAHANADDSVALGSNSVADEANTVSVGSLGNERRIVNVADGNVNASSTDAVNGRQLFGAMDAAAAALGGGATAFTAPTYVIQGSSYNNVGSALDALNAKVTEIDGRVDTLEANNVVANNDTGTDAATPPTASSKGELTGKGDLAGPGRDGQEDAQTASTTDDAGTGKPGDRMDKNGRPSTGGGINTGGDGNQQVASVGTSNAPDPETLAEAKTYTDTTATKTLADAKSYTDAKFAAWDDTFTAFQGEVDHRFREQDRRIDRQGAMGAAMLNMATSAAGIRTQNRVGVGVGFQNGESALSIGYQRAISDRAVITVGGAFSGDETSVGLGAGFGW